MIFPACKRTLSLANRALIVRRTLSMRQKQEHLYSTLLTSGEVLVEKHGAPDVTTAVVEALRLQWAYGFPYTPQDHPLLTHGFGIYPAGMQPAAASHLLKTILPGNAVFDPFLGGGTVVLEALRAGRFGIGSDISPLALFVARGRTWTASNIELEELREASRSICAAAAARLEEEARGRQVSGRDWEVFKSEIGNFLSDKRETSDAGVKDGLWFLFAVAVQRAAKARRRSRERNIVAHRFFERVCVEYTRAVERLTTAAIHAAPSTEPQKPLIFRKDARQPLASVERESAGSLQDGLVDAVLTSPPYPGVYDYLSLARQARSNLGRLSESSRGGSGSSVFLDAEVPSGRNWASAWTDGEVGSKSVSRRRRRRSEDASRDDEMSKETAWENDQKEWLMATTSALRAGGRLGIMIGDGDGIDTRSSLLRTVEMLRKEGNAGAVEVVGWATLRAGADAKRRMRTEHIVVLEKE